MSRCTVGDARTGVSNCLWLTSNKPGNYQVHKVHYVGMVGQACPTVANSENKSIRSIIMAFPEEKLLRSFVFERILNQGELLFCPSKISSTTKQTP